MLIHSTNGDLLRSLDVPDNVSRPNIIQLNREGYIVVVYDRGLLCLYGLNGRFLLCTQHSDHIQVLLNVIFVVLVTHQLYFKVDADSKLYSNSFLLYLC